MHSSILFRQITFITQFCIMRSILLLCVLIFSSLSLCAQLSGKVTDRAGEPLPYVSIYIAGASQGTTTNAEGRYELRLPPGDYEVVYQFIGYETHRYSYDGGVAVYDVVLDAQALVLDEVVVAADAEDPAYRVIRAAIAQREYHRSQIAAYSCDVYVKGFNKMLDAPEKIMGVEVGDLEGALDSNRQGIVYLSESVSQLHYRAPDEYKEVVISSKLSGDDQGYSFNSASDMHFNIYDETMDLSRQILSPIADNALRYYRYQLEGTYYEEGRLINKIKVIPKRDSDPVFSGMIYIIEDQWNVHSFDLLVTKQASQLYFLDTLVFNQVFVPVDEERWALFNNTISFKFGALGFIVGGNFTAVYSNYDLEPSFEKGFFNSQTHIVTAESNEKDSSYWESIRPVPLTSEERIDYVKKDSIYEVRNSPAFKDSVDRENNRFEIGDIVGGYDYQNSSTHSYWEISSLLNSVSYNTVQGLAAEVDFNWRKYFDEEETRRLLWYSRVGYGFAEKKWRASGELLYRPDRLTSSQYGIYGGSAIHQYNREEPISTTMNMVYTLLAEKNFAKYYDRSYAGASWRTDLAPGVVLKSNVTWEQRNPLVNNTDWTIIKYDDREFSSNDPQFPDQFDDPFDVHQAFLVDLNASFRIGQTYTMFPDRRYSNGYDGPLIQLSYRGAFRTLGGDVSYQKIAGSISQGLTLGVFGDFEYYVNGGVFLDRGRMEFMDYRHFLGTEILYTDASEYGRRFLFLPYYSHSADEHYLQAHVQHDFNGWIMDKIPLMRKLGFSLVTGAKYLKSDDRPSYAEFHVGLDNIGWDFFRLFRVDAVMSLSEGRTDWGARIAIGLSD